MALDLGSQHRLVVASITLAPLALPQPPFGAARPCPLLPPPPDPRPTAAAGLARCHQSLLLWTHHGAQHGQLHRCLVVRTNNGIAKTRRLQLRHDVSDRGVRMQQRPPHE